jgi:hypothetical protein
MHWTHICSRRVETLRDLAMLQQAGQQSNTTPTKEPSKPLQRQQAPIRPKAPTTKAKATTLPAPWHPRPNGTAHDLTDTVYKLQHGQLPLSGDSKGASALEEVAVAAASGTVELFGGIVQHGSGTAARSMLHVSHP